MAGIAPRFVLPYQTVIDSDGAPIAGAKLWFYLTNSSTPLDTYSNPGLTIANTNPVRADGGGRFGNIFLQSQTYKVVLTDSDDNEIWTADPVVGSSGGGGGGGATALREVSTDTIILSTDGILEVDASSGGVSVTFPLDLGTADSTQPVTIVKTDASNNLVSIYDDSSPPVLYAVLNVPGAQGAMQSQEVYSNGTALRCV